MNVLGNECEYMYRVLIIYLAAHNGLIPFYRPVNTFQLEQNIHITHRLHGCHSQTKTFKNKRNVRNGRSQSVKYTMGIFLNKKRCPVTREEAETSNLSIHANT